MYLSFQKINTYSRCGVLYYLKYVKQIETPSTPVVLLGKAVHKSLESFYKEKLKNGENLKVEFILETYTDTLNSYFDKESLYLEPEEKLKGIANLKAEMLESGIKALKTYYKERATVLDPWLVEEEFAVDLETIAKEYDFNPDCFKNVKLIGYVDLICDNSVYDHKTKTSFPKSDEADTSQQLTIYALGFKEITGRLPEAVYIENIILPKSNSPARIITQASKRTDDDLSRLLRRILRIADGIRKGVFIPPDHSSWACKYCIYRKLNYCKEYII